MDELDFFKNDELKFYIEIVVVALSYYKSRVESLEDLKDTFETNLKAREV